MYRAKAGVTLMELLMAVCLITIVVVSISLTSPHISTQIVSERHRWLASSVASAQIELVKSQPYGLLEVTAPADFEATTPLCDCHVDDLQNLTPTLTQNAGTSFKVRTCIHFVSRAGNTWNSQCAGDTGYKNIIVQATWTEGSKDYSVSQESLLNRY